MTKPKSKCLTTRIAGFASALAAIASAAPATAANVTFSDDAFNLGDYTFIEYAQPGYDTLFNQNGEVVGSEFNTYFSYGYGKSGANPGGNRVQAFNNGFVYNPGSQGVITSIDASLDQRILAFHNNTAANLSGLQRVLRVLAMQNGSVYEALVVGGTGITQNSWHATSASALTAASFLLFDPANPNAPRTLTGLDFGGSAITFGFELVPTGLVLSNGSPTTGRSSVGYHADNFRLTVNALDPIGGVPEPSAWALLILGFGATGGALRRHRKQRVTLAYA